MRAIVPICALILAACAGERETGDRAGTINAGSVANTDAPVASDDPPVASPPDRPSPDCPVTSSSGWQAHVDAMPGPNRNPRLFVSGRVTVPTGGYQVSLRMGQVAESYPVQVTVYLDAKPPRGMATQALVTHDVRGNWPSEERVGSVTVRCGSRALARIDNVRTAH